MSEVRAHNVSGDRLGEYNALNTTFMNNKITYRSGQRDKSIQE